VYIFIIYNIMLNSLMFMLGALYDRSSLALDLLHLDFIFKILI